MAHTLDQIQAAIEQACEEFKVSEGGGRRRRKP